MNHIIIQPEATRTYSIEQKIGKERNQQKRRNYGCIGNQALSWILVLFLVYFTYRSLWTFLVFSVIDSLVGDDYRMRSTPDMTHVFKALDMDLTANFLIELLILTIVWFSRFIISINEKKLYDQTYKNSDSYIQQLCKATPTLSIESISFHWQEKKGGWSEKVITHQEIVEIPIYKSKDLSPPLKINSRKKIIKVYFEKDYVLDEFSQNMVHEIKTQLKQNNKKKDINLEITTRFDIEGYCEEKVIAPRGVPWYVRPFWRILANTLFLWYPLDWLTKRNLAVSSFQVIKQIQCSKVKKN
ncbi:hypothetical protein DFA_07341 [Cavenderia fasciculata]|uniref:Transmembrane protein n=1 Tax=Cavenderia fasciculata TaxID=261658 RepID=F4PW56_CACFS|nr:uncharacterized protein DFA_07341 [Cavenderia fasciculata]EGG20220.1 hypothetical protein DFA_07341 [Cavenderia fasciculata]|eukprot:XP_004367203.1 hypothetical protein DFA_07341 [Cavenderia fasciculata]